MSYPTASPEEIAQLKSFVKKVNIGLKYSPIPDTSNTQFQPGPARFDPTQPAPPPRPVNSKRINKLFEGDIAFVDISREPLKFDNPVILLAAIMPELKVYKWQYEQLLMMAGYLTGRPENKVIISDQNPFLQTLCAANGSGKDLVIIAGFAVWFSLTGLRNRVIATSSSFDQTKFQTEVHISDFIRRANNKFGKLFHSIQFHHIVPELGSEIKLFATDEPGRAEGWHPFHGGKMALILNEAKSIREELFEAIDRCTGYSHLLYISSPGPKRGRMYKSVADAISYPNPVELGKFYFRKVTALECPHIPRSHIDRMIYEKGVDFPWVRSSIFAEFSDYEESVVIPEELWDNCAKANIAPQGDDIGIGLDLSGGGDEIAGYVRKGNRLIHKFFCRIKDTTLAISFIDKQLEPWKKSDYVFRADNGGIGQAMIDALRKLGWRVRRTNNNSPAFRKSEFLNLGAEMYFDVKRLIARFDIILPTDDPKLKQQITTRCFDGEESKQGKFALQPKKQAIAEGRASPDRSDGFVLCFSSYHPRNSKPSQEDKEEEKSYTIAELLEMERKGLLFARRAMPTGGFTQMIKI